MKKNIIRTGLLISALTFMGFSVGCGMHNASPEKRADHIVEKITGKLDLNKEQVSKLEIVKNEFLSARKEMKEKKNQARTSISEILEQPRLDQDRILSMVSDKTQFINTKAPKIVSSMAGFYDSLSPEQQKMLREKFKDRMEHSRHSW